MAVNVPLVGHLRVLSLTADIRDEISCCSKYLPKEQVLTGSTIRSFPASSLQSLGFKPNIPSSTNLAQIEVLLQHTKILEWRWTVRSTLQICFRSCVVADIFIDKDNGIDFTKVAVDQTLTTCVRKRIPVSCVLSDNLIVIGFSNSELVSYRPSGPTDGSSICHFKRRSKLHNNCEMQMVFSSDNKVMLLCVAPVKVLANKQWFPKKTDDVTWMLHVYSCHSDDSVPLKRLHRSQGKLNGSRVLQLSFLPKHPGSFLVLEYVAGSESSITINRYFMNGRSLQLVSSVSMDTLGSLLSSAVHLENELVAVGLEDFSVAVFDIRQNSLRRKICDIRPDYIRWSADGLLLAVISAEATVQVMDVALQFLPLAFVNETEVPSSKLRLRTCFNAVSPLAKCDWVVTQNATDVNGSFSTALLLQFERGPLAMLCFGSSVAKQLEAITRFRILHKQFVEVIRLLRMLRIVTSPEDIISGVRYLITTLIRLFPKATDEISAIICDALDLLYETSRLPDAVEWDLYEDAFQVLGRRSFSYLLRNRKLENALAVAKGLEDESSYKLVLRNAKRIGSEQITKAAEKEIADFRSAESELLELLENQSMEDQPDYVTLYPSLKPTAPPSSPSPVVHRSPSMTVRSSFRSESRISTRTARSERHVTTFMWTDMGDI